MAGAARFTAAQVLEQLFAHSETPDSEEDEEREDEEVSEEEDAEEYNPERREDTASSSSESEGDEGGERGDGEDHAERYLAKSGSVAWSTVSYGSALNLIGGGGHEKPYGPCH